VYISAIKAHISVVDQHIEAVSIAHIRVDISQSLKATRIHISARSLSSLSGQSQLGKLFKSRVFMVDICK
jgi:hypothetical protein